MSARAMSMVQLITGATTMCVLHGCSQTQAALRHPFFAGMGSPPPRPPRAPFRWLLAAEYADRMIVPTERLQVRRLRWCEARC